MTLTPIEFGLPEKFSRWRTGQEQAFWEAGKSERRWVGLALPTGVGKSAAYMAIASANGWRTLVLTATKGLQDQLLGDFEGMGLVDVRGMDNYPCREHPGSTCADGPCLVGWKCPRRDADCDYYDAVAKASTAGLVVSNYAFYFRNARKLGRFDCVVMDEAHEVAELLADHVAIRITDRDQDLLRMDWPRGVAAEDQDVWRKWGQRAKRKVEDLLDSSAGWAAVRDVLRLKDLERRLERLEELPDDWITARERLHWTFEPVWPTAFTADYLWHETPKLILSSATLRPRSLELLGLEDDDFDWIESASPFPVENRLVHVLPTARVRYRMSDEDMFRWLKSIDRVIDENPGGKGVIHTVSYERARFLKDESKHRGIMLVHDTKTARRVVREFKEAEPPRLLVSPSVTTGFDFPYEAARFQIVAKIPFPDASGPVMKARTKLDKSYPMFVAMTTLVQMAGRIVRAEDDVGITYILDGQARWFIPRFKRFAPRWFLEAVRWG